MSVGAYFSAANTFAGLSQSLFSHYGEQRIRQARFDALNAIGRDQDGFIKPVTLYEPGSYYGDAYNQVALTSFTAAARTSAQEQFRLAAVRNQRDPESFSAFAKGWIDRQLADTPPELQGALKLDLAEVAGQYTASIEAARFADQERQRRATLSADLDNRVSDLFGLAAAGDAAGVAKQIQEIDTQIESLAAARDYEGAAKFQAAKQRILKVAPLIGQAGDIFNRAEANNAGQKTPIDQFMAVARAAESGGDDNAKNPNSSATGRYQFVDETWKDQIKRNFPEVAAGKSDAEILALRADPELQDRAMRTFTQENYDALRGAGVYAIGRGELYAAHVLGSGGAIALLKANPTTPITELTTASGKRAVSDDAIRANKWSPAWTAGDLQMWVTNTIDKRASEAVLAGRSGSGQDVLAAKAVDIATNPGKYGLSEGDARSVAGWVQGIGGALSAAKVASEDTERINLIHHFGVERAKMEDRIASMIDNNVDPTVAVQQIGMATDVMSRNFIKLGAAAQADVLRTHFTNQYTQAARQQIRINEAIGDIYATARSGGLPDPTPLNLQAIDKLSQRLFGAKLDAFNPDHAPAIAQVFTNFRLLPKGVIDQLANVGTLTNAKDETTVRRLDGALNLLGTMAGKDGRDWVIDKLVTQGVPKDAVDRLVTLFGERGPAAAQLNEKLNLEKAGNLKNWKTERWEMLGSTPEDRATKMQEVVRSVTAPNSIMQALGDTLRIGGDNAVADYLAPRVSDEFVRNVSRRAELNMAHFSKPEDAARAAFAEEMKVSGYTTFLRRPGDDDLSPKLRRDAPETFWEPDAVLRDLTASATVALNRMRVRDSSLAADIGAMAGLAAAAVQQPMFTLNDKGVAVANPDLLQKLAKGELPSIDRDLTELDVKGLIATGQIELQVDRPSSAGGKPTYRVFANHNGRFFMLDGLEGGWQPSEQPGASSQAMRNGAGWSRRFAQDTGIQIPAVIPGITLGVVDGVTSAVDNTVGDFFRRRVQEGADFFGVGGATYDKLRYRGPKSEPPAYGIPAPSPDEDE